MEGPARLAHYTGLGILNLVESEDGTRVYEGLWQADDPEQSNEDLHRHYMAREKLVFNGPLEDCRAEPPPVREIIVMILEWSNEEHPSAIKLQQAQADSF